MAKTSPGKDSSQKWFRQKEQGPELRVGDKQVGHWRMGPSMGERGKNDDMKNRKTNLDTVEPDTEKPGTDDPMATAAAPRKPEARLGREVQARIGQQLRAMYDEYVGEGVPQHIADLIRRLSEQD
jgi:Anti-sigma factor NepR